MSVTLLDANQVIQHASDDANSAIRVTIAGNSSGGTPLNVATVNSLVSVPYDYIALTYILSGNGAGQIGTATYKVGGSAGTTVATLTLQYDAGSNLISVTKT